MVVSNAISLLFILSITVLVNAHRAKRSPILGGDEAQLNQFPHAVAIVNVKKGYTCSGGIIGEKYILSAAHCFTNKENEFETEMFLVYARTINHVSIWGDRNAIIVFIKRIFIPSEFEYKIRKADIAIAELEKDLSIQKKNLQQLDIPYETRNIDIGEHGKVASFGSCGISTSLNGTKTVVDGLTNDGKLRYANIEIVEKAECHGVPYGNFSIGHYHFLGTMIKNTSEIYGMCYGDSGSSFVYKSNLVIGVMIDAFDETCDGRTLPAIFTKVRSYLPFIRNVMSGNITEDIRVKTIEYDTAENEIDVGSSTS